MGHPVVEFYIYFTKRELDEYIATDITKRGIHAVSTLHGRRRRPDAPPPDGVDDEGDEDDGAERGPHRDRDHVVVRL